MINNKYNYHREDITFLSHLLIFGRRTKSKLIIVEHPCIIQIVQTFDNIHVNLTKNHKNYINKLISNVEINMFSSPFYYIKRIISRLYISSYQYLTSLSSDKLKIIFR